MTAKELIAALAAEGVTVDVFALPIGPPVRRFLREVDGRAVWAPFDVDDADNIDDMQVRSIRARLKLP